MRTCTGSWCATSRTIRSSTGTISRRAGTRARERWDSTRLMSPERDDNVRYWIATAPVGAASVLAEELAQFGATDIRERSHDVKFQGTLEVGYRACLWSRTATRVLLSLGSIEATSAAEPLRGRQAHRLARTPRARRDAGVRLQRRQRIHPAYDLRLAAAQGCGCDSLRDSTGERPNIRARAPRRAAASACRGPHGAGFGGFLRRKPAPAGLSHRGRPGAAQGERGGGRAVARGVAALAGNGGHAARSDVRLRHVPHRGALDRGDAAPALEREYFGFFGLARA